MAKKRQPELFETLTSSGMRKKVARTLSKSAGKASAKGSRALAASAENLRQVAAELDKRAVDPKRSEAGKKGARTRERKAAERSAAAKKGARTRAKSS